LGRGGGDQTARDESGSEHGDTNELEHGFPRSAARPVRAASGESQFLGADIGKADHSNLDNRQ
jgi:hypothetical protein